MNKANGGKVKEQPETPSELGKHDARYWLREIEAAKTRCKDWWADAEAAECEYKDESRAGAGGALNIFWANVETQKAAIGEDFGKPQMRRVNAPENDGGLARHVAMVWERTTAAAVAETNDNHDIGLAVGDVFVPGRGVLWVELEAELDDAGAAKWGKAPIVRVPYRKYLEGPADRWGSVPWVARQHEYTRDELKSICKLTDREARNVRLTVGPDVTEMDGKPLDQAGKDQFKRAAVWEIWTKIPAKYRLYVIEGFSDRVPLCEPDPLKLKPFFPCPRPMLANGDEGWQRPLTDLSRYADQVAELDRVCERLFILTDLFRNRGAFDAKFKDLADLMKAADNTFVGIDNWAELQTKGGLLAVIQALDLETIAVVVQRLREQRRDLIELIYELSGISDLARGMTDPNETLGAQKLKKSFGAGRFRAREKESRRLAAEAYTIKAEIIAEHFPREQIEEMSGVRLPLAAEIAEARAELQEIQMRQQAGQQARLQLPPPDPERMRELQALAQTRFSWERVEAVLSSDRRRCYSCQVETDQSQFVDEEADKAARIQLFQTVMQTMEQVAPMIGGNPKVGQVWKQVIMFVISAFKAGRGLEEGLEIAIDEAIAKAVEAAQQPQQQDPKIAAEVKIAEARLATAQAGVEKVNLQLQLEQMRAQNDGREAAAKAQAEQASAVSKAQAEQIKTAEQAKKTQIKAIEGEQKVRAEHDKNEAKRLGQQIDLQGKIERNAFEAQTQATAREALLKGETRAPSKRPAA